MVCIDVNVINANIACNTDIKLINFINYTIKLNMVEWPKATKSPVRIALANLDYKHVL